MLLFFDTETTGLYPGEICQLSYIIEDPFGKTAKNFYFTVDKVEYGAFLVHGLSVEKLFRLSGGKRFADFIDEIAFDFASADIIIAHNIDFDLNFMRTEFERAGRQFTYKIPFCSMKNAVPVCKILRKSNKGYKYPKLAELVDFCSISETEIFEEEQKLFAGGSHYHDARFDTVSLMMCCEKLMETYPEFIGLKENK